MKVLSFKSNVLRAIHAPFQWWARLTDAEKNGALVAGIFAFLAGIAVGIVSATL